MKLEQRRRTRVALDQGATLERLAAFLSRPVRPLRGLLHPERLQQVGPHLYDYKSRPYSVAGWILQPHVRLEARWDQGVLHLRQLESRVEGLGQWQDLLHFGLEAWLQPGTDAAGTETSATVLEAEVLIWARLPGPAAVLAAPVLNLGGQQLLDRLERRCQQGLRRRAEGWFRSGHG
jgi:hypothetical protein